MTYDLIIIGGGPAACAAAVYAARKQLNTLMIATEIGGQSSVSDTIFNWIGTPAISGSDLAKSLKSHVEEYTKSPHTLTLNLGKHVERVNKEGDIFTITIEGMPDTLNTRAVLIATGSNHRKLEVPGAADFEHKGIMYCATCDGPLFSGQPVAVIGGGNAALEAVVQLAQYASHVTLIHRSETYRADPITVATVFFCAR
jgi:alkyl hydroperoxide reductase subunit F